MFSYNIRHRARKTAETAKNKSVEYYKWTEQLIRGTKYGIPLTGLILFLLAVIVTSAVIGPETITLAPSKIQGDWQNTEKIKTLDLDENAAIEQFNEENSGFTFYEPKNGDENKKIENNSEDNTATGTDSEQAKETTNESEGAENTEETPTEEPQPSAPTTTQEIENPATPEIPEENTQQQNTTSTETATTSDKVSYINTAYGELAGFFLKSEAIAQENPPAENSTTTETQETQTGTSTEPAVPNQPEQPAVATGTQPTQSTTTSRTQEPDVLPTQEETATSQGEEIILPNIDGELQTQDETTTTEEFSIIEISTTTGTGSEEKIIVLPDADGNSTTSETKTESENKQNAKEAETTIFSSKREMVISGFSSQEITVLDENISLKKVELMASLGMEKQRNKNDVLLIDYRLSADESWRELATLKRDKDYSNRKNRGYLGFEIPIEQSEFFFDPETIEVRFTALSVEEKPNKSKPIFIDSAWLEISYEGDEALKEVSEKREFQSNEIPEFRFKYKSGGNLIERFAKNVGQSGNKDDLEIYLAKTRRHRERGEDESERPEDMEEKVKTRTEFFENREVALKVENPKGNIKPGRYVMTFDVRQGDKFYTQTIEFFWGVLAINFNKSIYTPGEEVHLQMGALTDTGGTICDAKLRLTITPPKGFQLHPDVEPSGKCRGNNITDVPDYSAYYTAKDIGKYIVKLERLDESGVPIHMIEDSFEVMENIPFEVERIGPTRIYPPADYEMRLIIKANEDFDGHIIELMPVDFAVEGEGFTETERWDPVDVSLLRKALVWNAVIGKGETIELSYIFDAPNISPALFLLGPLTFEKYGLVPAPAVQKRGTSTTTNTNDAIPEEPSAPTTTQPTEEQTQVQSAQ